MPKLGTERFHRNFARQSRLTLFSPEKFPEFTRFVQVSVERVHARMVAGGIRPKHATHLRLPHHLKVGCSGVTKNGVVYEPGSIAWRGEATKSVSPQDEVVRDPAHVVFRR
jgi:hypothetical protein